MRIPYNEQHHHLRGGGSIPVFRGKYQYGTGIGSFFSGLWRTIRPLVMPAAKAIGKQALTSTGQLASDLMEGQNFKEAARRRLDEGTKVLGKKLETNIGKLVPRQEGEGRRKTNKRRLAAPIPVSSVPAKLQRFDDVFN